MELDEDMDVQENNSVYNQTLFDERILVRNWRFVLEGVMIPSIGIPGIIGNEFFSLIGNSLSLRAVHLRKSI